MQSLFRVVWDEGFWVFHATKFAAGGGDTIEAEVVFRCGDERLEFGDDFGIGGGDVVRFADVGAEVVELGLELLIRSDSNAVAHPT